MAVQDRANNPLPVALLSGFLGVGKTTLLNNLLSHCGGLRVAVMVNDIASMKVDEHLVLRDEVTRCAIT
jgi:G3E family GTPase